MPTWRCRPYHPGDETRLAALFEAVFDRPMTPVHWLWKLAQATDGVPNVWVAVDDADRPIGQYGGVPRHLRLAGQDHPIMVAVDAMTHPGFRRRGVLTAMVRKAHASWRSAGVTLVLGMPNEQWRSRRAAVGWQSVTSLRWFVSPLNAEAVLARRMGWAVSSQRTPLSDLWNGWWDTPPPPGLTVREAVGRDATVVFDAVCARTTHGGGAMLNRDSAWMTRRLLDRPSSPYRVLGAYEGAVARGYIAFQVQRVGTRRVGTVTELAVGEADTSVGRWLLRKATRQFRAEGADVAMALAVPGTTDATTLRRAGFVFTKGTFSVDAVVLDTRLPIESLRRVRWKLRGSDFDLI